MPQVKWVDQTSPCRSIFYLCNICHQGQLYGQVRPWIENSVYVSLSVSLRVGRITVVLKEISAAASQRKVSETSWGRMGNLTPLQMTGRHSLSTPVHWWGFIFLMACRLNEVMINNFPRWAQASVLTVKDVSRKLLQQLGYGQRCMECCRDDVLSYDSLELVWPYHDKSSWKHCTLCKCE